MRRGTKPAKAKVKAKPPARKARGNGDSRAHDLEKRLAEALKGKAEALKRESEALEQQTATAEILRVISQSPTNLQPVLDAVVRSAARFCGADDAELFRLDGEYLAVAAHHGPIPAPVGRLIPLVQGSVSGRAFAERRAIHVADLQAEAEEFPVTSGMARELGFRASLSVPLLREGMAVGTITLRRAEVNPFTDKQIKLLQTFADQAVIAIENVRLFNETKEALERQTATSEILRVISTSPTDVQPVFDAIAGSSRRLCNAFNGAVFQFDGELIRFVGESGIRREAIEVMRDVFPAPPSRNSATARAILERAVVHISNVREDSEYRTQEWASAMGIQSVLSVPMLHEGRPIGAITVNRVEAGLFPSTQVDLLKTFADQAVIAIENVRLFKELEARNHDLTEALEQLTATSEILRVISSSPTDVEPVFDTIIRSAVQLCDGLTGTAVRFDGEMMHLAAGYNYTPEVRQALEEAFPMRPGRRMMAGRAILSRTVIQVEDALEDPEYGQDVARAGGFRSMLAVPMMREGNPIGAIVVNRGQPGSFSVSQIDLLKTFADQAVIAIENVRLFTELQASNRELTTALDTQTATSDILRVISRSQTDVQSAFDAIVASAVRLLGGYAGMLIRIVGDQIELAALTSIDDAADAAERVRFPRPLQSEGTQAQAIRDRAPINIADAQTDPRVSEGGRATARARGYRSWVVVPLLRHDAAIGAISVTRRDPGGFTGDEIALLKTFADQAVIAIENARLFKELEARTQELTRSVDQLTALGEVGRAVSSTLDLETVLTTIVSRAVQLSGLDGGVVFEYDEGTDEFVHRAATETGGALAKARRTTRVRKGEGVVGRTAITLEPVQVPDITGPGAYVGANRENLIESGIRAILAVPMVREDRLIGCLVVSRNRPGGFPAEAIELLRTFATQSALAIQNARLFHEIADKSRQLEAASRHKSEFLANMSHELRTPLNAVIGFSEVLLQRMFGDLNAKQDEYLKDIYASGQHLLSLINDILDLSKIEAGRMELTPAPFHLPSALENAVTLVKERAARHGIALQLDIDPRLGEVMGDERKVKQVLLNLLSNSVKFTPEGGRITLKASRTDGAVEIAVTDTGIGIAPEDQAAIFEEFRQVGTDETRKQEGTGLGLTLAKKFVELHGGRIWVESDLGHGSTFTFTLPVS
ncbi:MAG TPA: GAF domain-containing protein [Candidatus Nitrosotalea sp.]|nr:GAF domain-containing protein [Candidatus Nitrosotalea sp.]